VHLEVEKGSPEATHILEAVAYGYHDQPLSGGCFGFRISNIFTRISHGGQFKTANPIVKNSMFSQKRQRATTRKFGLALVSIPTSPLYFHQWIECADSRPKTHCRPGNPDGIIRVASQSLSWTNRLESPFQNLLLMGIASWATEGVGKSKKTPVFSGGEDGL
jgi:hypothetical protein